MKKFHKTPFTIAMGASLLPLTMSIAQAESNPFALSELGSAYMQTAETKSEAGSAGKMKDGACGEGKCGAAMMKQNAGSDKKNYEAKCAGNKAGANASPNNDAKSTTNSDNKK